MQHKSHSLVKLCLSGLVILLVSFLLLELILRISLNPAKLYAGLPQYPDYSTVRYENLFLEQHADAPPKVHNHDPLLGWDFDIDGDRIRGDKHYSPYAKDGIFRILTIGDSFTYGNDVKTHEAYPAALQRGLPDSEVINMGVPGYGIDQAYLKYRSYGKQLHPDIVILGIFLEDYERSSLAFFAFAKPVYRKDPEGLYRLHNQPVPTPLAELARIRKQSAGEIYSLSLLRNFGLRLLTIFPTGQQHMQKIDGVIEHILGRLATDLESTGTRLLIVQFPDATEFNGTASIWNHKVALHLRSVYRKLELSVIDLSESFRVLKTDKTIYSTFYVHRPDGSTGHLSVEGNAATAKIISERLGTTQMQANR